MGTLKSASGHLVISTSHAEQDDYHYGELIAGTCRISGGPKAHHKQGILLWILIFPQDLIELVTNEGALKLKRMRVLSHRMNLGQVRA